MYSYGPPHMAKQKQDDQLELTYSSYVKTQDVTRKTCRRRWTIGRSGERVSGISVLAARYDDDDDDDCFHIVHGFNYCNLTLIIHFNIKYLFAHCEVVTVLPFNTNYSTQFIHLHAVRWFQASPLLIIIMFRCQHGSPGPSLAILLYHPSLPGGLPGYIQYRHRPAVYRF